MVKWITIKGLTEYENALRIMEAKLDGVIKSIESDDTILLMEHNEVYTAGASYKTEELLKHNLFPIIYTNRGGKFTYHGPGQRVIYPIINLNKKDRARDLKLYVAELEKWVILTLEVLKVQAFRIEGKVGVWVKNNKNIDSKIAAIGIRVKKWITYHGIAVNLSTDLNNYSGIIPCGIKDFPVTSLKEIGVNISLKEFDSILKKKFLEVF